MWYMLLRADDIFSLTFVIVLILFEDLFLLRESGGTCRLIFESLTLVVSAAGAVTRVRHTFGLIFAI
jgi:hypothetical protein